MAILEKQKTARQLVQDHVYVNMQQWVELALDQGIEEVYQVLSTVSYEDTLNDTTWEVLQHDNCYVILDRSDDEDVRVFNQNDNSIDYVPHSFSDTTDELDPQFFIDGDDLHQALDTLFDLEGVSPLETEALEFWAVSPYLAERLRRESEAVVEVLGVHIWGRTCSGQAIAMDGVITSIAND